MSATPKAYIPRFYSEVVKEVGSPDDCAICSGLTLFDAATLGEGVTRDDGGQFDTIRLRELRDEAGLKPDGGLRLNDIAKYLAFLDERAGMPLPRFALDYYPGHPGGKLVMDWPAFKARMQTGSAVAILLGNPIGVKDPASPLRTVQNSDDYGHAIAVMDGRDADARVFNALRWKQPGYRGERVPWSHLKQFTEAEKNGDRLFGTPRAIAVAIAEVGSWTVAAREATKADALLDRMTERYRAQREQTTLTAGERDAARAELQTAKAFALEMQRTLQAVSGERDAAKADLAACKAATPVDCSAVAAERDAALAHAAEETDRAVRAESIVDAVRRAVAQ